MVDNITKIFENGGKEHDLLDRTKVISPREEDKTFPHVSIQEEIVQIVSIFGRRNGVDSNTKNTTTRCWEMDSTGFEFNLRLDVEDFWRSYKEECSQRNIAVLSKDDESSASSNIISQ